MPTFPNLSAAAPYSMVSTHQRFTSMSSVQQFQLADNATGVLVQAITQNVRMTLDGSTVPTASIGFQIRAGDPPVYIPVPPRTILRFIEETASANLQYQQVAVLTTMG